MGNSNYKKKKKRLIVKSSVNNQLIRRLILSGGSLGSPSTNVNTSITQYVINHINGLSVIDLVPTCRNRMSVMKLMRIIIKVKLPILIVANKPDHARIALTLFNEVPNNVYVLTNRWNPGMFSNYNRFSKIVHVFKRMSDTNKTETMKRQYIATYGQSEMFYTKPQLPRLVVFIDVVGIETAISEVTNIGIPTVGFVNTDYNATNSKLTYLIPLGSSIQSIALIRIVLRNIILNPVKPVKPIKSMKVRKFSKRTKVWFGKYKWKNLIMPVTKSSIVSKFLVLKIRIALGKKSSKKVKPIKTIKKVRNVKNGDNRVL